MDDPDRFIEQAKARLREQGCTCDPDIYLIDGRTRNNGRHMMAVHADFCPADDGRHEVNLAAILEVTDE